MATEEQTQKSADKPDQSDKPEQSDNEQTETQPKDDVNRIGDRDVFHPNVWSDEFSRFGITSETPTKQAKTILREQMGLPERHTKNGLKAAVKRATAGASSERVKKALDVLSGADEGEGSGDGAQADADASDSDARVGVE